MEYGGNRIPLYVSKEYMSVTLCLSLCALQFYPDGSGRQGCNPAGESPVMIIVRFGHVAIPRFWRVTSSSLRGVNVPAANRI